MQIIPCAYSVRDEGVIESISSRERLLEDEGPWRVSNVVIVLPAFSQ